MDDGGPISALEVYAKSIEAMGPAWANTAQSIRAGFRNCWIDAAVAAIDQALNLRLD
jgi:hypothetical protein